MNAVPQPSTRWTRFNLLHWAPVAVSVLFVVMVALVSVRTMSGLKNAIYWRQHSFQEIQAAHEYEENAMNIQNTMRDFVTTGDADALAGCQRCTRLEPQLYERLVRLTRDNPVQEQRLKALSTAMKDVFDYEGRLIDTYKQQGAEAVLRTEQTGQGRVVAGRARDILTAFSDEEQRLLDARDAAEQTGYYRAERMLIVGSVLAAVLLVLAHMTVGREMARRHQVELDREKLIGELRQTLAQVKTLSGLIPICAWCKSVRNDQGYWQSVEQYVHSRSDASFSHSICPACREKFKDEIARMRDAKEPSAPAG